MSDEVDKLLSSLFTRTYLRLKNAKISCQMFHRVEFKITYSNVT